MFTRPGCGLCDALKGDLQARGVPFLCVDVTQTRAGNDALRDLGKNVFGMTSSMPTPTTLVGTRIIRGSDTEGVLRAMSGG
jgi:glutaredoxin